MSSTQMKKPKKNKLLSIVSLIIRVAITIYIFENWGLLSGIFGYFIVSIAFSLSYTMSVKSQREYVYNTFMAGVRQIELLMFGMTFDKNEEEKKDNKKYK